MKLIIIIIMIKLLNEGVLCSLENDCYDLTAYKAAAINLVASFAKWRQVDHIFVLENEKDCLNDISFKEKFVKNFMKLKMSISFTTDLNAIKAFVHRSGIIINYNKQNNYYLSKLVNVNETFSDYSLWLFLVDIDDELFFNEFIITLPLKLHSDVTFTLINKTNINNTDYNVPSDQISENINIVGSNNQMKYLHLKNSSNEKFREYSLRMSADQNKLNFIIKQIYKVSDSDTETLVINQLGYQNGIKYILLNPINPEKRLNLLQKSIKVSVIRSRPEEHANEENIIIDKFLSYLKEILNMRIIVNEFQVHNLIEDRDTYMKYFESLKSQTSDFGIGFTVSNYLEFSDELVTTFPIMYKTGSFYFYTTEINEYREIFLSPFKPALLVSVLILIIGFSVLTKITNLKKNEEKFSFIDSFIWCVGIFFMQGTSCTPTTITSKFIIVIALFFAFIIYNSYSAAITSILTNQNYKVKTINDLINLENFTYGYVGDFENEFYLNNSNDPQTQNYYKLAMENKIESYEDGIHRALTSNFAFYGAQAPARQMIKKLSHFKDTCLVSELDDASILAKLTFSVSKKSQYRKIIIYSVLKLKEHGLLYYFNDAFNPELPECTNDETESIKIKLTDVISAFGVFFIGFISSIILCNRNLN